MRYGSFDTPRPWEHVGLTKREYMARAPWRVLRMKRVDFERMILDRPSSDFTEMKRSADAQRLLDALTGGL